MSEKYRLKIMETSIGIGTLQNLLKCSKHKISFFLTVLLPHILFLTNPSLPLTPPLSEECLFDFNTFIIDSLQASGSGQCETNNASERPIRGLIDDKVFYLVFYNRITTLRNSSYFTSIHLNWPQIEPLSDASNKETETCLLRAG